MAARRIIVGISGASGFVYGVRLLQMLRRLDVETHLIVSTSAQTTMAYETGWKIADVRALADHYHRHDDMAACVSSGSYRTLGMIVAPCSMKTLADIASA
ncbi:MAG: UbiX family flavin prenyltransferase, partial [Pseudomonadota bacterium]|nr:UbiX family flavin prenyltransferase [Pseudomonadota bacterium]